jgi:transcriptional regulator with XRE-family HTH domain
MHWYERVAAGLDAKGVSKAAVGRELGMTGAAITHKLQGQRPTNIDELKVMCRLAGLSVSEALGDEAVVIELRDEIDLVELYRLLTPEQRKMLFGLAQQLVGTRQKNEDHS